MPAPSDTVSSSSNSQHHVVQWMKGRSRYRCNGLCYTNYLLERLRKLPTFPPVIICVCVDCPCYLGIVPNFSRYKSTTQGGTIPFPPKFEHIFVAVITFSPFLLCRYFYYQLFAYCVCFKMICKKSL